VKFQIIKKDYFLSDQYPFNIIIIILKIKNFVFFKKKRKIIKNFQAILQLPDYLYIHQRLLRE